MIRTKYYKDLNHNYLIIITKLREGETDYQHRMITQNRMVRMLPCKIRYVNEECHFYYDISSRQSLKNAFDKQNLTDTHIHHLLEGMQEAQKELESFLLDSRCLLLCPEYIYVEPETEEYFYIYYPYYMEEINDDMKQTLLAEFLVEKVNHEEEETVAAVYKIYEMIQDDKFILSEALRLFEKEEEKEVVGTIEAKEERECKTKNTWEEMDKRYHDRAYFEKLKDDKTYEMKEYSNGDYEEVYQYKDAEKSGFKGTAIAGMLSILTLIAAAAVWSISYFFTLTVEEKLASVVGIIVLIMISAFFLVYFLFHFFKYRTGGRPAGEVEKGDVLAEELVCKAEMGEDITTENKGRVSVYKPRMMEKRATAEVEEEIYGNTVFLETSVKKMENKLYGVNKGNKYHIDLGNLPCTVGKMAGSVDMVICDKTISRLHARIWKEEENIYVTDLNSTNGTFKNGLRVDPNETVAIEPGDEIRFGGMTFCYR